MMNKEQVKRYNKLRDRLLYTTIPLTEKECKEFKELELEAQKKP